MKIHHTHIAGLVVCEPQVIKDSRGSFFRTFCSSEFQRMGLTKPIAQMNQSLSKRIGTIRGLHFQYPPFAETKIVKCLSGCVYDVAVDLRAGSNTFLQWHGEYLSSENNKMMVIPEGFAHGFQVIEENTSLLYLHTEPYMPDYESGVLFSDELIGIRWPIEITEISDKDLQHKKLDSSFHGIEVIKN
jgi:dTDP-4-dehydrorhamnose 3,5-epimerase